MYTIATKKHQKKGRENKKLLPPSSQPQPINEINYEYQSFTDKQFGPC